MVLLSPNASGQCEIHPTLTDYKCKNKMAPWRAILRTFHVNIFILLAVNDFFFHRGPLKRNTIVPIIFILRYYLYTACFTRGESFRKYMPLDPIHLFSRRHWHKEGN